MFWKDDKCSVDDTSEFDIQKLQYSDYKQTII